MKVRLKDIAKGYRISGFFFRLFVPYAPRWLYPIMNFCSALYHPRWRSKTTSCKEVFLPREDGSKLRCLVYSPIAPAKEKMTCVVYFHGGGYASGTAESGKSYVKLFTQESDAVVVSVDYRLSTKAPYPAALDDACLALKHLHDHAEDFGIDPRQIFVAGESSGGGLACAAALRCRDTHEAPIACQIALYPMLDDRDTETSHDNNAPVWNHRSNVVAWKMYLRNVVGEVPPYAAPARAESVAGLPPLIGYVGELDPFFAEDMTYVSRLSEAGIETRFRTFPKCFHTFDTFKKKHPLAHEAFAFLKEAFAYAKAHYRFKGIA